jgi:hypothetical protein
MARDVGIDSSTAQFSSLNRELGLLTAHAQQFPSEVQRECSAFGWVDSSWEELNVNVEGSLGQADNGAG